MEGKGAGEYSGIGVGLRAAIRSFAGFQVVRHCGTDAGQWQVFHRSAIFQKNLCHSNRAVLFFDSVLPASFKGRGMKRI
jgi:hypothetical protein